MFSFASTMFKRWGINGMVSVMLILKDIQCELLTTLAASLFYFSLSGFFRARGYH